MKNGRKMLSFILSFVILFGCLPFTAAEAGSLSCYSEGYHHWPGVCLGGARLTAFGADEISKESYNFSSDSYEQNREMNVADAPVATYYTEVNTIKTLSDLTSQKGFKMNIRVTRTEYCTVMQYLLTAGTSGYSTSVSSLRSISPSVGNNEDIYVYGPAPTAGGQIIEIPMTLWTYISQGGQYIYAGYKVVLRLVGYDMAALSALVAKETENNRPAAAYTSASFAAYASALSAARDMLAETKPQQTGIDAAFSALQSAISGLVSSGEADPADLYAAIDEARALDANAYTDFSGVRTAVNAALAELAAFENTTQERLDNRAAAIRLAVAKLTVKPAAAANRSVKVEGNHHWSGVAYGGFRLSAFGADETTADYNFSTDTQYMTREMNADDAPVATYYYDVNLIRTFADLASQKGFRLNYAVTNTSYADIMNYYISTGNSSYSSSAPNQIYVGSGYSANQTVNGTLPSVGGQELVLTLTAWTDIAQQATINNNTRYIHAGAKLKLRLVPFDKSVLQTAIGAKVYPQSFYTAESWQNYLSALSAAAAVNGKTVLLQSEIDEAAAALNGAIDALEFVSALDLTDLEAAIAEALALNAGDYVDFSGVTAAVDAAQDALYGAGDRTQEDIGNLAGAIRLAIRKLVAKPVSSPKSVSVTGTQDWTNVAAGTCRLTAFGADETTDSYNYGNGNWVQTREMSADLAPVATYYYDVNTIRTFADLAAAKGFRLNYTVVDRTYADIWNYWIGTDNSNYTTTAPGQIVLNGQPNGYNENRTVNGTLPSVGGQELTILLSCWTDMAQSGTITSSTYIHCGIKLKLRLVPFDKTALYAAMDTAIEPESHYTPESYAAYLSAIDAAAAVCAKAVVTQAEIDAAKNALLSAIDALTLKSFTVTFLRWDGATVDTQTVSYGQDAAAPATAATTYDGDNHYTFSAWSGDWTNVNSDRTVTALCDTAAHYGGTAKCNEYAKCDLCGAEYGDYADHEYGAWIPQVDKTCLEDGTLGHYTCSVCGKYFDADHNELTSLTIAHEGHKPVKTEEKASTCTEKGNIEYYTCDDCGKIFTEEACEHEITAEQTVLDYDYTNHSTDERVTKNAKDAKCNEDGYTGDIYCAACDHEVTHGSVIPKESIAHTPVKTEEKAATCTEKGNIEYYTCEVCGRIFTEETCENEIAADDTVLDFDYTNHSTDERVTKNAKDAKCNEDGYTGDIYCAACDHEVTHGSVIPKESIAHTPVKTEEKAATCTDKGNIEYYTCSVCGKIFTEEACTNEITAEQTVLDFDYTNHSTDERVTKNAKDAKCNEDGYTGDIYCAACDHEVTHGSVIAKETIAHTPVKTDSKASTCTEKGNIEYYTCSVCGKIFTEDTCENEITADDTILDFDYTNHSTTETVTKGAKAATCNEDGYTGDVYCAACDHLIEAGEAIPSGGTEHVFGEWYVKTAPTCTEEGVEARVCGNCGEEETRPIAATGHSFGEWFDDEENGPTCGKDGVQHRVCAKCGETETREVTASEKGHSIRLPNDEGEGYCAFCGEYRCLFCEKDEHMHETNDASVMTFFVHIVHIFYHMFSNFRYTLSHR